MEGRFIIKKAGLVDAEKIADFNVKLAEETESKLLDKATVIEGVKSVITHSNKGFYLVAKDNNSSDIIGQLLVTFEWSDWRNKCFWWIQSVYIPKKYRNQKIFSQLYRSVIEMAKRRGDVCGLRLYVEKYNEQAKRVYEALEMTKTSYEVYETDF